MIKIFFLESILRNKESNNNNNPLETHDRYLFAIVTSDTQIKVS
jgi:hypothetical protein